MFKIRTIFLLGTTLFGLAVNALGGRQTNCWADPKAEACLFWKNPVAHIGQPLTINFLIFPVKNTYDLSPYQTFAVKMPKLDESGYLSNENFFVQNQIGEPLATKGKDGSWKYRVRITNCQIAQDCQEIWSETRFALQVSAFYWANYIAEVLEAKLGFFYSKNKKIQLRVVDFRSESTGWSREFRTLFLSADYSPLSAEVIAHELGHANLTYANPAFTRPIGGLVPCSTIKGCAAAIDEGQADYHAALAFSDSTSLMQLEMNSFRGSLGDCGASRDVSKNADLTIEKILANCPTDDHGGRNIYVLGSLYASIWWEVRKQAGVNASSIDQLFSEHLRVIDETDDFNSLFGKVKIIEMKLFHGKYTDLFTSEIAKRGLN